MIRLFITGGTIDVDKICFLHNTISHNCSICQYSSLLAAHFIVGSMRVFICTKDCVDKTTWILIMTFKLATVGSAEL